MIVRIVVVLVLLEGFLAEKVRYDGWSVYRLTPTNDTLLETLQQWNEHAHKLGLVFWNDPSVAGASVDVQVSPDAHSTFLKQVAALGFPSQLTFDNVQTVLDEQESRRRSSRSDPELQFFTEYRTYDEIYAWLATTRSNCPSGVTCTITSIGTSWEGRDLRVFKISSGPGKKAIWIDSLIHAREWVSGSTGLFFIDQLVNNYNNAENRALVDRYDWVFMPIVNIDGYQYTFDTDRMWRRTRSDRGDILGCVGCDANRNFDFEWMTIGASNDPCSDTYAGASPFSEPETAAVGTYVNQTHVNNYYAAFLTLHSYSQLVLLPYGYTIEYPPDYDEMMRVANLAADDLFDVHGTVYEADSASIILYPSSGTSRDWAKGVPRIKYVYTFELRDTGTWGFILPPEQIIPTGQETWAAVKRIANEMQLP